MAGRGRATKKKKRVLINVEPESSDSDIEIQGVRQLTPEEIMKRANSQNDEVCQKIRDEYRNLQTSIQEKADEAGNGHIDLENIKMYVFQANSVFASVKRPREAVMDAQLLRTCGALAKCNIEAAQSGLTKFRPCEFAQNLINFINPETEEEDLTTELSENAWIRLGEAASPLYCRTIGVEPLYSALEWEKPKPAVKQPKKQLDKNVGLKRKPERVEAAATDESHIEEVVRVLGVLKKAFKDNERRPINFFKFVVNPKSYTYTIENMFAVSFLVRDQHVKIIEDRHGIPVIYPVRMTDNPSDGSDAKQMILTLTMAEWKEAVKVFKITSSMIPPPSTSN